MHKDVSLYCTDEHAIDFLLIKSKRKSISIRITDESMVYVSAPVHMSLNRVKGFVDQKHKWILNHKFQVSNWMVLPVLSAADKKTRSARVRSRAKQIIDLYPGKKPQRIFIRYAKTRWGSCSSLGNISLNGYLDFLPDDLFEYVLFHELTHLDHMNHSRAFWDQLSIRIDKPRSMKSRLIQYKIPASV